MDDFRSNTSKMKEVGRVNLKFVFICLNITHIIGTLTKEKKTPQLGQKAWSTMGLMHFSARWCHYIWPFCSCCCPPCVSIYLAWLPLSRTFPLLLLPRALCGHTTGDASVLKLMQYPFTSHRQQRPSQHICPFKWNFLQTKSQLRVRFKSRALIWDAVSFGPWGIPKRQKMERGRLSKNDT